MTAQRAQAPGNTNRHSDPLALVTAAINCLYARADLEGDATMKGLALMLLSDVARRRKQVGLQPNPIELAHTTGSA